MKRFVALLLTLTTFAACNTTKKVTAKELEITYLDEFVVPANLEIDNTIVGGLSGIDFHEGTYYLVCDQPSNPRIYKAEIPLSNKAIDSVIIKEVIKVNTDAPFFKDNSLDLEAVRYETETNELVISSEGAINREIDPSIFHIDLDGNYIKHYKIPDHFTATGEQKPRNNGVFEGLSKSVNNLGYWVGMELPLEKDGPKPKLFPTNSPVRITYFDKNTQEATSQFAYQLDGITKIPFLYFAVNGVTEILEYEPKKFLILERAFSAGRGTKGNTVKIFEVDAQNATNTLQMENLKKEKYTPAVKRLIFDFKSVRKQLTDGIIDNIEGMTLGPILPNGNQSLILVSDDNFSSFGRQLNQFILLEIRNKK